LFFQNVKDIPSYHLISNPRKLSWLVDTLLKQKEFGFDIETNYPTNRGGRKPPGFVEVLSGISFAWGRGPEAVFKPGNAAYVPIAKEDDSPFWHSRQDAVIEVIREVLESNIPKIAQYGKFDMFKLCRLHGITVKSFAFDTHLAHSLLDEERLVSSHALKSDFDKSGKVMKLGMADRYLDSSASQPKDDLDAAMNHYDPDYRRYSKVPLDILYKYGCSDSDYALALKYIFEPMLEKEGIIWVFQNIVMPLQTELVATEICGMPVDLEVANRIKVEQEKIIEECLAQATEILGAPIDLGSPAKVGRLLFEELKLPGGRRNKQGWVTDSETLERMLWSIIEANKRLITEKLGEQFYSKLEEGKIKPETKVELSTVLEETRFPLIEKLLRFRRASKIYGSYIMPALENVDEVTNEGRVGWIHTTYFPDSLTGRLRGSDPSLVTLPRPENGGEIVKSMFAGGEDYRFIFKDYSQIELRFIAHCSGEPVWIEGFNKGIDAHALMAQKIWHPDKTVEEVKEHYPADRSNAKVVNFSIAYGKGVYSLAQDLGISFEEADKMINEDYFGAAPVLKTWIDDLHQFAKDNGYVQNIFGRRRHLPDAQIYVPEYMPWPNKLHRPDCYRKGPYFGQLGLDQDWNETGDDWYHFVNNLDESKIKGLIIANASHLFQVPHLKKCSSCSHVFTCVINTEIKRLGGLVGKAMRQSINSPIQGGASDMMSLAWTWVGQELRRQELDAYVVLNVHDELVVYSHVDCIDAACKIMESCMCERMHKFIQFSVPLVADVEITHRWSEKYDE